VTGGYENQLYVGSLAASPTTTYTFTKPETLIFSVPEMSPLSQDSGGVSVLISPVFSPPISIQTESLHSGTVNQPYSATLAAAGGSGFYSWSATGLPAGLTFGTAGVLSGAPTVFGTITGVSITVTDLVSGLTASQTYSITINPAVLTVNNTPLPAAAASSPYSQTFTSTGGAGGDMWSLAAESTLPAGLTLAANGALTGTPTVTGSFSFTVMVTDNDQNTATQAFTLHIDPALSVATTTLSAATVNQFYLTTLAAEGGSGNAANYSWSATALPAGLTLTAAGSLRGTPTVAGAFNISVTVTDSASTGTATASLSLTVYPSLTLDFADAVDATNPLGYFRLNQTSGTSQTGGYTYMDSETGASIATPGAPVTGTPTGATQLDGTSGQVTTSLYGNIATAGSMMAWINLSALPSSQPTFSYIAGESEIGNDFDLQFSTGNVLGFYTTNSGQSLSYTPDSNTLMGQWHMIVVTFDNTAGQRAIYWDGNVVSSDTTQSIPNKTGNFQIGATSVFGGRYFPGSIAEVGVWNYALTAAQVSQLRDLSLALPAGFLNVSYGPAPLTASGGSGNYTYTATGLPAGLNMTPAGSIKGTPLVTGTFAPVAVTATDTATNLTVTQSTFSLMVYQPVTVTSSLPNGVIGTAYSQTLAAAGGSGSGYIFSVSAGLLPTGLSLSATTGAITGTPSATGIFSFTVQATDGLGNTGSQQLSVTIVNALSITTVSLPAGEQTATYNQTLMAMGGTGAGYMWSISSGALPAGLSLAAATGVLSGIPSVSGTFPFTVQATDSASDTAMQQLTLTLGAAPVISTASLPTGVAGFAYSQTLMATGGAGAQTWSLLSGTLPAGLSLNSSTGTIAGTPAAFGTSPIMVKVTDGNGGTATQQITLQIVNPVSINTPALPSGAVGEAYNQTINASGGVAPLTFSISAGSLASPLQLNATTGAITGTPTSSATSTFTVKITDASGTADQATQQYSLAINPMLTISTASLPNGTANQAYSATLAATGGSANAANYTWSATGLPAGFSLSAAGVLSGMSAAAGTTRIAFKVADSGSGETATATLALMIVSATQPVTISASTSVISIALGGSVSASFSASGGTPPYTFTGTGLPAGVSVSAGGSLSGTPTQAGNFSATVQVTDQNSASAGASITINVLGLSTGSLPGGTAGQFYSANLGAIGWTQSYSFSATGLPTGLSLGSGGSISGTVNTPGTYTFSAQVSSSGVSASGSVSVTFVKPQALAISSASLPAGTVNAAYSQSLAATGGTAPYSWSVSSGSPPAGLSLSSSGTLSGIPTSPGSFSFGVMATDSSGGVATATASVTIQPVPLTITTQALPSGVSGLSYPQQTLGATGGVSPYTWSVTSGNLPSGMTLSTGGSLTGTPAASGSFPVSVTVTDSAGANATANLSLAIRPASTVDLILSAGSLSFPLMAPASVSPPSQTIGVQSTQSSQPIAYTVSVNPPAPWLTLTNGSTTPGTIQASVNATGLMSAAGDYQTTIGVTCTSGACSGNTQSVSVDFNVKAGPPQLQIVRDLRAFGSTETTQSVTIQNAGGGSLGIGSVTCEASWCSAGGVPGTLGGGMSGSIPITVNPALLTGGFFRTQVDIVTSAGKGSVPVTVLVSAASTMTLAPAGSQFTMQAGGAPGNPSGSFLVSVTNAAPINWTATVLPGAPWLTLSTVSGSASSASPGTVGFAIDPVASAALAPGVYYGLIQVSSAAIVNSPLDFEVVLSVSPATTPLVPDPEPAGLLFITSVGGTVPPQTVTVYSGSTAPSGFQVSATTTDGGSWLSASPETGSASSGSPGTTTVTVDTSSLKQGVYTGGVSYGFSATAVRVVSVTVIVAPAGTNTGSQLTSGAAPRTLSPRSSGACTPSMLVPAETGLVNNFSAPVAWPTPISLLLANDCGSVVGSGQIVATFSNGDPPLPLALANPATGLYSGTWTPRKAVAQMTITANASAPGYPAVTAELAGSATPNAAPVLTPHGTLHSFYPLVGGALAPGTIIQIYGQNLANLTAQPTTIPLPTTMNGTSVIVGGIPAPLYYVSAGQINAQLPFELNSSNSYQVLILANGALTTPDTIQLSPATPGMAAFSDSTLIAQHGDGSLVSQTSPAQAGEYLVAYLAGMGDTNNTPASGAASPVSPLALPTVAPTLTINGNPYPIAFAGLTPGLVGLYQMNFQVPAGLPAGNIMLVVTQNGQSSNQTVLPYQP